MHMHNSKLRAIIEVSAVITCDRTRQILLANYPADRRRREIETAQLDRQTDIQTDDRTDERTDGRTDEPANRAADSRGLAVVSEVNISCKVALIIRSHPPTVQGSAMRIPFGFSGT